MNKKEVGGREINVESARPQNSAPGAAANGLKKKSNNKKKATGVSRSGVGGREWKRSEHLPRGSMSLKRLATSTLDWQLFG